MTIFLDKMLGSPQLRILGVFRGERSPIYAWSGSRHNEEPICCQTTM